jgi:ABC-type multidrug transport system fused ATPase/permease subunit
MSKAVNVKPLSEAISTPIMAAYKAGGLGLSFLTLGAIMMLIAFFWNDRGVLAYITLSVGVILIFATLAFFYFKDLRKLVKAQNSIQKNKELIDTIQQTALEMTELAYTLQSLTFKHADQVSTVIQFVRPQLKSLPLIGKYADSPAMLKTETLSVNIVYTTQKVREVINDLEKALIASDPSNLKKYLGQLHEYKIDIQKLLEGSKE